ncbi:stage II sporulation protein E [Salipaludibacillus sp. CF4.18]|uniref:stage II sporulation protein E n=1 Tax=Salipaludibacillus sp. CF4.18 TaxID=3373081 RepID=UPI003EE6A90B
MIDRKVETNMSGQAVTSVSTLRSTFLSPKVTSTKAAYSKWRGLMLIIAVGFLLGRAVILLQLLPFTIPFLAVVFKWKRSWSLPAAFALIAGSTTLSFTYAGHTTVAVLFYFILQAILQRFDKKEKFFPIAVFTSVVITRVLGLTFTDGFLYYHLLTALVEGGLALIITLIFMQSIPFFLERRRQVTLKPEEVVCLVILLGSLLTGTVGWMIYDLSIEHIFAQYIVLIFAFIGGATIGATTGVIMGLILSLANITHLFSMSLLAFAGLLGGLLREGRKISVAGGLVVASLLMAMYTDNQAPLQVTLYESLLAVSLFFLTPKSWTNRLASYIPGTVEHAQEQQQYLRKIRDLTAGKVEQFSELFLSLSKSFSFTEKMNEPIESQKEVDIFLSGVTEKTCQICVKKKQCWTKDFQKTYGYMESLMEACNTEGEIRDQTLLTNWKNHCFIDRKVISTIEEQLKNREVEVRLKRQLEESRKLVADQLIGVSQVMGDFARDIQREKEVHDKQEEEVKESLLKLGIDVDLVEIYGLDPGNVDLEMVIPSNKYNEAEKVIAPLLSTILNESIVLKHEEDLRSPNGETRVIFGSTNAFILEQGAAHTAKGGKWISGDSFSTMPLGDGKYAMAISDGMGNGKRAHLESEETIGLLKRILQSGIAEKVAIKSINSVLSLRSNEEMFATLDLAVIDLQEGSAKFLKVGSPPSFIKRGNQILSIESSNLPIGMIKDVDVDVVSEQLKAGDLLIMMSDGIYEAPTRVENTDMLMKRIIRDLQTNDPQEISDLLIEQIIRESDGDIHDDMTVLVVRVDHYSPKWATISSLA